MALALVACAPRSEQLRTAQSYFVNARWEAAETHLVDLESHFGELSRTDQVRFCWLRGAVALDRGDDDEAHHWLVLAQVSSDDVPGALTLGQSREIVRMLEEIAQRRLSTMGGSTTRSSDP